MDPSLRSAIDDAVALHRANRLDEAEAAYRRLLEQSPASAGLLHLLGLVRFQRRDYPAAVELLRSAIIQDPTVPEYHVNLAHVLNALNRPAAAAASLQAALYFHPDHPSALFNLAAALLTLGRASEALALARRLGRIHPAEAQKLIESALPRLTRPERHEQDLAAALHFQPDPARATLADVVVLLEMRRYEQAIPAARAVAARHPDSHEAHFSLGMALHLQGWIEEAVSHLRRAVQLAPDDSAKHSALLYALWFHPRVTVEEVFAEHVEWGRRHAPKADPPPAHRNSRDAGRPLRIGYVSRDFHLDPVDARFIEPALLHHDRQRFQIFCYCDVQRPTRVVERLKRLDLTWRDIGGLTHQQFAEIVRADEIDILVDLTSHLPGNRLPAFAFRPAPVQLSWLGQPTTTGVRDMDYLITDIHLDPPHLERPVHHTERLLRLPRAYSSFMISPERTPPVYDLPALRNGYLTFGSTHTHAKLNEPVLKLWAELLQRLPNARLLIRLSGGVAQNQSLLPFYHACGLPADRIEIVDRAPAGRHLELYQRIDLSLDSFPYAGYTNALESLWMGVPYVAFAGLTACSRLSVGLLHMVSLNDLVTETKQSYLDVSTALAGDLSRLAQIRLSLRRRIITSPLADHAGVTRDLEELYRNAWRGWVDAAPK